MSRRIRSWTLSALTMATVATVVLLVTGWGSAIASSVNSVIVTNPASNPAQVHEAGTANVNVTNTTPLPVNARNLNTDAAGNVKVAEQGTPNVAVTNFPATESVRIAQPGSSFSRTYTFGAASASTIARGDDPAGTRYAISNLTVTATGDSPEVAILFADPVIGGVCDAGDGQKLLEVSAPANDTSSVSLSQPVVSDAIPSGDVCLDLFSSGADFVEFAGYTLP